MFQTIRIQGLGPHDDITVDLDPRGDNWIEGPSEAGKTMVIEAIAFCLWGLDASGAKFPPSLIREGYDECAVTLTTAKGTEFERRMRRTRGKKLLARKGGEETSFTKEDDFREALGPLGADVEVFGLILAPMRWVDMMNGTSEKQRALRDALTRHLASEDPLAVVAQLMAPHKLLPNDPTDEKTAKAARAAAKSERDQAIGSIETWEERLELVEEPVGDAPTAGAVTAARATLDAAEAWRRYATLEARWQAGQDQAARLVAWTEQREKLGDRPDDNAAKVTEAEADLADRQAAVRDARQLVATAERELGSRQAAVARIDHERQRFDPDTLPESRDVQGLEHERDQIAATLEKHGGDVCPHCQRGGWDDGVADREALEARLADTKAQIAEAAKALARANAAKDEAFKADIDKAVAAVEEAEQNLAAERERLVEAEAALACVQEVLDGAKAAGAEAREWDAALRALGPKPAASDTTDAPAEPSARKPTGAEVGIAQDVLRQADEAEGQRKKTEADAAEYRAGLERALAKKAEAEAEHARLDALVDAIRRAPSVIASKQVAMFGDLGPVGLDFPAEGSPVHITVDGREWRCASDGRRVVADMWFRAALRRVIRAPWMTMGVDRAQEVGGQPLPDVGGQVIYLLTTHGAEFAVRQGAYEREAA